MDDKQLLQLFEQVKEGNGEMTKHEIIRRMEAYLYLSRKASLPSLTRSMKINAYTRFHLRKSA